MISVKLIAKPEIPPLVAARQAAETCYQPTLPEEEIENNEKTAKFVKNKLFNTGHHTTLQHSYFTFAIDGIAVGDVTLGLHLVNPHYNSSQRSGRFCSYKYNDGEMEKVISEYATYFWPEITDEQLRIVLGQFELGKKLYKENIAKAMDLAEKALLRDRPYNRRFVEAKVTKIAQEQLRVFLPVILPTGLQYTINLSALVAMWHAAFTPVLRYVTEEMRQQIQNIFPELKFMFCSEKRRTVDWFCDYFINNPNSYQNDWSEKSPDIKSVEVSCVNGFSIPNYSLMYPVNMLNFIPEMMDNHSTIIVERGVTMSLCAMGQDQRHRTIIRSEPYFTGKFYLPPLVSKLIKMGELKPESIKNLFHGWLEKYSYFSNNLKTLWMIVAPYGAMVRYNKIGSLNAISHEQAERLCWRSQEEIFHLGLCLRNLLKESYPQFLNLFEPYCFKTGHCIEGVNYCGRDLSLCSSPEMFFSKRLI